MLFRSVHPVKGLLLSCLNIVLLNSFHSPEAMRLWMYCACTGNPRTLIMFFVFLGKVGLPSRRKTVVETYPAVLDCMTDKDLPTETVVYSWTKDGSDALTSVGATILASGALFIKDTRRAYIGVYQCIARTVDSTGLVSYAGVKTFLDVQCKL